jgi:hypothetical protein
MPQWHIEKRSGGQLVDKQTKIPTANPEMRFRRNSRDSAIEKFGFCSRNRILNI